MARRQYGINHTDWYAYRGGVLWQKKTTLMERFTCILVPLLKYMLVTFFFVLANISEVTEDIFKLAQRGRKFISDNEQALSNITFGRHRYAIALIGLSYCCREAGQRH